MLSEVEQNPLLLPALIGWWESLQSGDNVEYVKGVIHGIYLNAPIYDLALDDELCLLDNIANTYGDK